MNESNKKTDEPVPDVEGEFSDKASDEEQEAEVDIKDDDEEIDGKSVEDEEENVSALHNLLKKKIVIYSSTSLKMGETFL